MRDEVGNGEYLYIEGAKEDGIEADDAGDDVIDNSL